MFYHSTRGKGGAVPASKAILEGIAPDGGLYVPSEIPKLDVSMEALSQMDYGQVAYEVMKLFFTDFTKEELQACIQKAYSAEKFDIEEIVNLTEQGGVYFLELFHGETIAFKDMALSILPHLLTLSAKKNDCKEEIVILTATSGDTGKAALAGFSDVPGTKIIVYYPKDGVSRIQEKQMVTQEGENTHVIGILGNFDDAQNAVKEIFQDEDLKQQLLEKGYRFSSANSINIGRLIPQIVYYVYAYTRMLWEKINFVVPTGNFGNILAAHYAGRMGVPIHKLICASNENKVLYDFFDSGIYNRNRTFFVTSSPSMDILISSNLERLLYEAAEEETAGFMDQLKNQGSYEIRDSMKELFSDFVGGFASEEEMEESILMFYRETGYVMDPHTAVAKAVYDKYQKETGDGTMTVIASTASPYKFLQSVLHVLEPSKEDAGDEEAVRSLWEISKVTVPNAVMEIMHAPTLHNRVCEKTELKNTILDLLNISKKSYL